MEVTLQRCFYGKALHLDVLWPDVKSRIDMVFLSIWLLRICRLPPKAAGLLNESRQAVKRNHRLQSDIIHADVQLLAVSLSDTHIMSWYDAL